MAPCSARSERVTDFDTVERIFLLCQIAVLTEAVAAFVTQRLNGDRHYLTVVNGETWAGGFDLSFYRTRFFRHKMDWPFGDVAYADMMQTVDRFDTGDQSDSVGVYDALIDEETGDPSESAETVDAFEAGEWLVQWHP